VEEEGIKTTTQKRVKSARRGTKWRERGAKKVKGECDKELDVAVVTIHVS